MTKHINRLRFPVPGGAALALLAILGALFLPATAQAQSGAVAPTGFAAAVGNGQVTLTWETPPTDVTSHEFRYKAGTGAFPTNFTPIEMSAVGGTNQKSFTVTGLTNEVEHTFQLRAVNADGESTAVETDPVTPTPGICDRTDKVQEVILDELADATECAAVNVADLASIAPSLDMSGEGISSLKEGDFAGLTSVRTLKLNNNSFTTLPAGVFTGLTALTTLRLDGDDDPQSVQGLTSLPAGVFTGLTALESLVLRDNDLTSLPAGVFTGLTALESLELNHNNLTSLPATVFSGLTALRFLTLHQNDLTSLPDGVFTGLTALQILSLGNNPDTGDTLALTVTLEKFGTDQVRAKVPAGAPAAVAFTPVVVNGALAGSATALSVLAGAVEGEAVTVERTSGAAATVDIDLTTQPSLPVRHTGYIFAKAAGSEPLEFPPPDTAPDPPTVSAIADGTSKIVVSWSAPAHDGGSTITGYRLQVSNTGASGWSNLGPEHHRHEPYPYRACGRYDAPLPGLREQRPGRIAVLRRGLRHDAADRHDLQQGAERPLVRRGDGGGVYIKYLKWTWVRGGHTRYGRPVRQGLHRSSRYDSLHH